MPTCYICKEDIDIVFHCDECGKQICDDGKCSAVDEDEDGELVTNCVPCHKLLHDNGDDDFDYFEGEVIDEDDDDYIDERTY